MGYTQIALEGRLLDMYPEIKGLSPRMRFDEYRGAWAVTLKGGEREFTAFLKKRDADGCMEGTYCEAFGTDICEIIKRLK